MKQINLKKQDEIDFPKARSNWNKIANFDRKGKQIRRHNMSDVILFDEHNECQRN